ncbi:MAG: hypothetical protein WDN45_09090 [Caulobacteraceae bacterium]
MSTLDFTDREPPISRKRGAEAEVFSGNRALYERLQGRQSKSGLAKYGWVALPIAAVAIIGVVAATSTPHESASDVVGAPGQAASTAPVTASPAALASNSAPVDEAAVTTAPAAAKTTAGTPASPPAPVAVARRAPSSDAVTTRPASAAPAQTMPVTPPAAPQAPAQATIVEPPAPIVQPQALGAGGPGPRAGGVGGGRRAG